LDVLLLLLLPSELTFHALVELLEFGERSHQRVAVAGYTLILSGETPRISFTDGL
jgi:hypothetical protein